MKSSTLLLWAWSVINNTKVQQSAYRKDAPLKRRGLGESVEVLAGEALPAATAAASTAAAAAAATSCVGCSPAQHSIAQHSTQNSTAPHHRIEPKNIRRSDPTRSNTITVVRSRQQ